MTGSNKTCYLFTQSFPFGEGEVFVEKEIPFLSTYFKDVVIFPLTKKNEACKTLPENVSFNFLFGSEDKEYNSRATLKKNFLLFAGLILKEFLLHPLITASQIRNISSDLLQQFHRAAVFQAYFRSQDTKNIILYSYWFDRWALILSIAKRLNRVTPFEFVSRAHGYEIFKEQTRFGYHPFKNFMLVGVKTVYTVSKQGMNYLNANFPGFEKTVSYAYLGTSGGEITGLKEDVFHVVSCAHVREIKRLDRVCDILACMPKGIKLKWTLIGDGKGLELIKQQAAHLEESIECCFTGNLTSEEVMQFYSRTPVNLFLSVSRSEGLPYTMMEAISFGIPILSTDVGGCKEIVTDQTGILIKKDFDPKEVAGKIVEFKNSEKNSIGFRQGVRKFWEENFNAEKNYFGFYKKLVA